LSNVKFSYESIDYQFNNVSKVCNWLNFVASSEYKKILNIQYFLVKESTILEINKKHLNHNYTTDVISFNYSFLKCISGDIYICIPIVELNSKAYSENNFEVELLRVILHGLLHLIGYNDLTDFDKAVMRKTEDHYLNYLDRF
jgi:probable rRNA maturation factor